MALFSEHMYTFLLDIRLGVKLLGQRLCIYLALGDTAKQFNKVMVPIYVSFGSILRVQLLHNLANTWYFLSFSF